MDTNEHEGKHRSDGPESHGTKSETEYLTTDRHGLTQMETESGSR